MQFCHFSSPVVWVQPHGRGENSFTSRNCRPLYGTAPRAWGEFSLSHLPNSSIGYSPTGVGRMIYRCGCRCAGPVQPHGRGENRAIFAMCSTVYGTAPRAWGECVFVCELPRCIGYSPTGVGRISDVRLRDPSVWVQPHGRGENATRSQKPTRRLGTAPRAWGESKAVESYHTPEGYSPTGVGRIFDGSARGDAHKVQPHGRGENTTPLRSRIIPTGTAPRAWGEFIDNGGDLAVYRYSPTGVGRMD